MTNNMESWQRLEAVIKWADMSTNFFARHIGLSRPDIFYNIKSGKGVLSNNLARRIVDKFPEISIGWLLSGEGEMLGSPANDFRIPFYEGNVTGNMLMGQQDLAPSQYLYLPVLEDCDCAFRSYDDAIAADIMPGSIVFLKKNEINAIIPGGMYVIVSSNFVLLRRVRIVTNDDNSRELLLEGSNGIYDSLRVAIEQVKAVFRVVGTLRMF